jgi:hypothetical protein
MADTANQYAETGTKKRIVGEISPNDDSTLIRNVIRHLKRRSLLPELHEHL